MRGVKPFIIRPPARKALIGELHGCDARLESRYESTKNNKKIYVYRTLVVKAYD